MRFLPYNKGLVRSKSLIDGTSTLISSGSLGSIGRPLCAGLIMSGLFGCGLGFSSNKLKQNQQKSSHPQETIKETVKSEATINITGLEPYHYQAEIKWPAAFSNVSVYIDDSIIFKAATTETQSCFLGLKDNKDYTIRIVSEKATEEKSKVDGKTLIAEWKIKTPRDVILNNDVLTSEFATKDRLEIQANRIFIPPSQGEKASFVSDGREVLLITNELIAEGSSIATFSKNQKANFDKSGRTGGTIIIKAKKAKGEINFELRGESGGDGKEGLPFIERAAKGAPGFDGISMSGTDSFSICTRETEDGKPGLPGEKGRPGSNGKQGGNSGLLKLEISESSPEFHFKILKEAGVAGIPGNGGPGQLGGLGGDPGKQDSDLACRKAKPGLEGKSGEQGANGIREADGVIGSECISIGEGFGRCS